MKSILKKAGIPYTSDIVGAATDIKKKSVKRTGNLISGIIFLALGILLSFLGLAALSLLLTTPFGAATFGILFLFIPIILGLLFTYIAIVASFSTTSDWFLVLYDNSLLYKYKQEDDSSETYGQIEVPIEKIKRCYLLCEYRRGITVKGVDTSGHFMSVHILYDEDNEKKYISVYNLDGYKDISKLLNHLEKEKNIPIYYATAHQELGEELNDMESLENADLITFGGNLKDYHLGSFLN